MNEHQENLFKYVLKYVYSNSAKDEPKAIEWLDRYCPHWRKPK